MRHRVTLLAQFLGQLAHTLARPAQRRLRVAPRYWLHQTFQVLGEMRILASRCLATASDPANPSLTRSFLILQLFDPLTDDLPRQTRRPRHRRDPSPSYRHGFAGSQVPTRPFIQFPGHSLVSLLDLFFSLHHPQSITSSLNFVNFIP